MAFFGLWEGWAPANRLNYTSWIAAITQIDRPKSFDSFEFSFGIETFVMGLSQISSLFSLTMHYL